MWWPDAKIGERQNYRLRQNGAAVNAEDVDSLKPGDRLWFCRNMNRKTLKLPVVFPHPLSAGGGCKSDSVFVRN